ncbi:hypothetical protein TeGR_g11780 [Tetraparma gracilis]|uniref:RanBP2-type domain-containing protein n=1 Tax=Tetraparma gracilis TaxID=2962635 RepID=A0ABQ6NA85_9STRA|nr:hypothetical protein TeGR_g11780 [Tetraparma gracilis]
MSSSSFFSSSSLPAPWTCGGCTYENRRFAKACEMCNTKRRAGPAAATAVVDLTKPDPGPPPASQPLAGEAPAPAAANPFASFSFGGAAPKPRVLPTAPKPKPASKPKPSAKPAKPRPPSDDDQPVASLPPPARSSIIRKWLSLASPSAPSIEARRFQVLVAARLHARCREPVVREAMRAMHGRFPGLCAGDLAGGLEVEELAAVFPSVHFGKSKAEQIIKFSNEVLSQFAGRVPSTVSGLKELTGIGAKFADLLAYVNTEEKHRRFLDGDEFEGG